MPNDLTAAEQAAAEAIRADGWRIPGPREDLEAQARAVVAAVRPEIESEVHQAIGKIIRRMDAQSRRTKPDDRDQIRKDIAYTQGIADVLDAVSRAQVQRIADRTP